MVASRHFPAWLASVRHWLVTILSGWGGRYAYEPVLSVLVFRRSGRHRAVAASEILKDVAEQVEGLHCLPIINARCDDSLCRCARCSPNRFKSDRTNASVATVADIWRGLHRE